MFQLACFCRTIYDQNMTKTAIIPIMILAMVVCCMGQTFQYSRGWTNGKRSDTHADESTELMIDADWEKKLEK